MKVREGDLFVCAQILKNFFVFISKSIREVTMRLGAL